LTFEVVNENRQIGGKETNLCELLNLNIKKVYEIRPHVLTIISLRPAGLSSARNFFRECASVPSSAAEVCGILRVSRTARHCAALRDTCHYSYIVNTNLYNEDLLKFPYCSSTFFRFHPNFHVCWSWHWPNFSLYLFASLFEMEFL